MGRHHVRIYHELPDAELVGIVDLDKAKADELARQFETTAYDSIEPLLDRVQAISVAVPTVAHVEVARPLLARGLAVLVEKPLAADSAAARELREEASRSGALLQVGHTERFNPVVRAMSRMKV